ncbi:MAG: SGNH/GDSL hydrolase family protein, partial [Planctomycetes bacterium]|nr:SGNH/GDSL hydrolase family protein [Planctomycetota bacterium]
MTMLLLPSDPRLALSSPVPVLQIDGPVRLERFARSATEAVAGQLGPLANLRSSSGCSIWFSTDSPWVELHLERLRHHQPVPCGISAEIARADGGFDASESEDLRERDGAVAVRLPTGLERGSPRTVSLWLPLISTCAIAGVEFAAGATVERLEPPTPRWLAIGDSLTQGFSVQSPRQNWVHRLSRRWDLPAWNLGVGGIRIEPAVFAPALAVRTWDLVTIALGSNHAWKESDAITAADRAAELADLALAGGHRRIVWLLPPWKPCEDGLGPAGFAGVPLDRAAGE